MAKRSSKHLSVELKGAADGDCDGRTSQQVLVVKRRREIRPRDYDSSKVCVLHLQHVGQADIDYLLSKMTEIRVDRSEGGRGGLFELHIRRDFFRDHRAMYTKEFVDEAAETARRLATLDSFLWSV